MAGQMVVDFLARKCLVTVKCGFQYRFVMLDIHRDEVKIPIRDHELLAKPSVNCVMHGLQRF